MLCFPSNPPRRRWVLAGALGMGLLAAGPPTSADEAAPPLVSHWAPVIYHDLAGDYVDDYMTRFDFDGDWDAWNNEESMRSGNHPLVGAVYYSTIETETHWYLTYAFFHPYDSSILAAEERIECITHENDMEGVILTIRKDGTPMGSFRVMATEAHGQVYYFKPAGSDVSIGAAYYDGGGGGTDSTAYFPLSPHQVAAFIEPDGHGVGSQYRALEPSPGGPVTLGGVTYDFPGGDGIIYYHDGGPGEEPTGVPNEWVRYDLRPLEELWLRRHNPGGSTYCGFANFVGNRGCTLENLAVSFGGTCWPWQSCAANPPWGWDSDAPGSPAGEWFLDPAYVVGFLHLENVPERFEPGFLTYVENTYLQGDLVLSLEAPVGGAMWWVGTNALIEWTHDDTGQGPIFAGTVDIDLSRGLGGWEPIAEGVPISAGSFSWPVTGPPTGSARIRVRADTDCVLTLSAESETISILSGTTAVADPEGLGLRLQPARPNPFVHRAVLAFDLQDPVPLRLQVFDIAGRPVRTLVDDARHPSGSHAYTWNGEDDHGRRVAPGLYYYRLEAGDRVLARKLVLAR